MAGLLAVPILGILLMVQTAVVSRLTLLHGTADMVILAVIAWALHEKVKTAWVWGLVGGTLVSLVSATPYFIPLISYLSAVLFARLLQRQVWQTPILAMFATTLVGTLVYHVLSLGGLLVSGTSISLQDSLILVSLPSALLNIILALPVYIVITDLANWVYPVELT